MASFYVKTGDDESTDEPVVVDSEQWAELGVSDSTLLWADHLPDCASETRGIRAVVASRLRSAAC